MRALAPEIEADLRAALAPRRLLAVEHLAGDVSTREHFRLRLAGGDSVIATLYPAELAAGVALQERAHAALATALPLPRLLASNRERRWTLEEDAGDQPLAAALAAAEGDGVRFLLDGALALLAPLQQAPAAAGALNPPFDAAKFRAELEQTRDFLPLARPGRVASVSERNAADAGIARLAEEIAAHPRTLCHRDYHAQNIHVAAPGIRVPGFLVIDYQDARRGPDTYDAASLLRERAALAHVDAGLEDELLALHAERMGVPPLAFRERYEVVSLQRMLKACGTFARYAVVQGSPRYLGFLDATAPAVARCLERLPRHAALAAISP